MYVKVIPLTYLSIFAKNERLRNGMTNIENTAPLAELRVKLLNDNARIPQRATNGSAGYDLCACLENDITIAPGDICKVSTGIAISIDSPFWVGLVYARSGLAAKQGLTLINCVGVVDSDYRGELIIPMINHGKSEVVIKNSDRIAQLVLTPIALPRLIQVDSLEETERGSGGFGSTGIGI